MLWRAWQWAFGVWVACREVWLRETEKPLKVGTAVLLLITAAAFVLDENQVVDALSNYRHFSDVDAYVWAFLMTAQAVLQFYLMRCSGRCLKCRAWSDVVLQISGLQLLVAGGAFVVEYPPFFWQMAAFPFLGFAVILAGRSLGRRSRRYLKRKKCDGGLG